MRRSGALRLLVLFVLLGRLPLAGAALAGHPPQLFEEPLAHPGLVRHAPHSWPAFAVVAATIALGVAPFASRFARFSAPLKARRPQRPLPAWGWAGAVWLALWWAVAWTRIDVLAAVQPHTFTPLWMGYVVVISAWTWRRAGTCALRRAGFATAAALSAVFWWFFEYLNRFVESWSYGGADLDRPLAYVLFGTLPFATVLPAVMCTQELLGTFPRLVTPFAAWRPVRPRRPQLAGGVTLTAGLAGVTALSLAPSVTFPLPWLAPLLILVGYSAMTGRRHVLSGAAAGDFRDVVTWALAGLACGWFWEMWNAYSLARWSYTIPYVGGVRVFEMPLLGYAGYLPFGLECAAALELVGAKSGADAA